MASRFQAWLRRKLRLGGKSQPQETTTQGPPAAPRTQKAAPPAYSALGFLNEIIDQPPQSTEGSENIEITEGSRILEMLRAQNPATKHNPSQETLILRPPQHKTTPAEAAKGAAEAAVIGMCPSLDESDPSIVAARTAQAIAVAVSTSRSYAAFVAAVTAAESSAYLTAEYARREILYGRCKFIAKRSISDAVDTALAADAGITPVGAWPIKDPDSTGLPPRTDHHPPTCACRLSSNWNFHKLHSQHVCRSRYA